jgi:hypothetical protein
MEIDEALQLADVGDVVEAGVRVLGGLVLQ